MIYFKEEQRLGGISLWTVLLTLSVGLSGGVFYAFYRQLQLGQPLDDKLSDNQLIIIGVSLILLMTLIDWLLLSGKLEVEIRNHTISYRFFPFIWNWKVIKKGEIAEFEVQKYNAMKEHGGHGYRQRPGHGTFLSVKGNMALILTLKKGKKLLLGTQKPKELKHVVEQLMKNETDYG